MVTMRMNGVKHYFKYSMNECINNLKKLFICEVTMYIYETGRLGRANVPNVLNVLNFLKTFAKTT